MERKELMVSVEIKEIKVIRYVWVNYDMTLSILNTGKYM